jgi:DNA-binding winged helix-turn-helix (wHTH) protein
MDSVSEAPASVEFGRFSILPQRREVFADGRLMELGGRAFDVLVALIEAQGAVVSKDKLMSRVWPGRIVEENNLHAQVKALRTPFSKHDLVRTIVGRGYQFTGEIRARPADHSERHRTERAWSAARCDEPSGTDSGSNRPRCRGRGGDQPCGRP